MRPYAALLILAIIVLIFIVIAYGAKYPALVVGAVVLCLIAMAYSYSGLWSEKLTEPIFDDHSNFSGSEAEPTTSSEFSSYQNIGPGDVDSMWQRNYGSNLGSEYRSAGPAPIDNSDVVEESITRGNIIFQPNQQGISATSSGRLSAFGMGEPGETVPYGTPMSNRITLDEALTRAQQHRGGKNKAAIDGAVRATRNKFQKYFQNELDANERKVWWSAEADDNYTDFLPPY